jgi:hypothetical protein
MSSTARVGRVNSGGASAGSTGAATGRCRDEQHGGHEPEMHAGVDVLVGGEHADARRQQAADAPEAVQAGHDRAPEVLLDVDALGVHRHVAHAGGRAVDHEGQAQPPEAGRERGQRHRTAPAGDQDARDDVRGEAVHERRGERHGDDRADRRHEQREAQLPRPEAEAVADPWDARGEAADGGAVDQEDDADGDARAAQRGGRGGRQCADDRRRWTTSTAAMTTPAAIAANIPTSRISVCTVLPAR